MESSSTTLSSSEANAEIKFSDLLVQLLDLETIEKDIYRSKMTWQPAGARGVFGGNVCGQALVAARRTVEDQRYEIHSLHSYFLRPGNNEKPILYRVQRTRDGKNFATRSVEGVQDGHVIYACFVSFQVRMDSALDFHAKMPTRPAPEALQSLETMYEQLLSDESVDDEWLAVKRSKRWPAVKASLEMRLRDQTDWIPIEMRPCVKPDFSGTGGAREPRQAFWMRAKGQLVDDPAMHRCVAA